MVHLDFRGGINSQFPTETKNAPKRPAQTELQIWDLKVKIFFSVRALFTEHHIEITIKASLFQKTL